MINHFKEVTVDPGGGALDSHVDGGCRWGSKTLPCRNTLGAQKIHPVTIYLAKNFHMHTLSQYCTVTGAQNRGMS